MKRETYLLRIKPGAEAAFLDLYQNMVPAARAAFANLGLENASVWRVGDLAFGYREAPDESTELAREEAEALRAWETSLLRAADFLARPGEMRRMYTHLGAVRADKSQIRHRVFATRLKPGCAEEYRARHAALERVDRPGEDTRESNFTIWNAGDYIFGYCEIVKALDFPPTEAEKAAAIAWEKRQLEIMDWLTDDVDWITGEHHEKIERIF